MNDFFEESESKRLQLDVFREIGNIGSGNAVTALSTMLDKKIDMSVPEVQIVTFDKIVSLLDGPETLVVGILVDFTGDMTGFILLILGIEDAYEMVSIALGDREIPPGAGSPLNLTEMELDTIKELANILIGSYLSAICSLTRLSVVPSIPHIAMDMIGAILSIVAIEYGKVGDTVLFLKTKFSDITKDLSGHFFLIPDPESYKVLMESLGLEI